MSYYGDGSPYFYGGPFSTHSSLMTGTGRVHTPLRYSPHLSTISESPLSTYRRYAPSAILPSRTKRIIDTADIDVSTPRSYQSPSSSSSQQQQQQQHGHRLRRDRPTIRIRSQALKNNPALRDHYERREKSIGEQLVEKFLIKDKKIIDNNLTQLTSSSYNDTTDIEDQQEAIQKRVTRRMTRRRSSADIQMDSKQLQREMVIAQVQAEVLDNLVAEEQAEIEVETKKGNFIHKNTIRCSNICKKTDSDDDDDINNNDTMKKIQKKAKKRKKSLLLSSSTQIDNKKNDNIELFKVEEPNNVDDLSTKSEINKLNKYEQFRESIHLPNPGELKLKNDKFCKKIINDDEKIIILPVKKSYVLDKSRNSAYLTLKPQILKTTITTDDNKLTTDENKLIHDDLNKLKFNDVDLLIDANIRSNNVESDVEVIKRNINLVETSGGVMIADDDSKKNNYRDDSNLISVIDDKSVNTSISNSTTKDLEEPCQNLDNLNLKNLAVSVDGVDDNDDEKVKIKENQDDNLSKKNDNNLVIEKKINELTKDIVGDIENNNIGKCKIINVDDNLKVVKEKKKYDKVSEVLPSATVINLGTCVVEKNIEDTNKIINDNLTVDDCIDTIDKSSGLIIDKDIKKEEEINLIEKNVVNIQEDCNKIIDEKLSVDEKIDPVKIDESNAIIIDKKKEDLNDKLIIKNKTLVKLKYSSTDSGIGGSIDSDVINSKITNKNLLKNTLVNSKGHSFECDDDVRVKIINSTSRETTPEIKDSNKIIPVKKVKKKIAVNKKLSSFDDKLLDNKNNDLSSCIDKIKPIIEPVKESSEDVDFWSEIKSKNQQAVKNKNITLKKSLSEPIPCVEQEKIEDNHQEDKKAEENNVNEIFKISEKDEIDIEKSLKPEAPNESKDLVDNLIEINNSLEIPDMVVEPTLTQEVKEPENNSSEFINDNSTSITPTTTPTTLAIDAEKLPIDSSITTNDDKEIINNDEDDDESPKTPTNEEEEIIINKNISKWDKSLNLFELDDTELSSTTTTTNSTTTIKKITEKEKEVIASVVPQASTKKKLTKRKKSTQKLNDTSVIRKIRQNKKSSTSTSPTSTTINNNSKNKTIKKDNKKILSPRVSNKIQKRPQELFKMFYTTPTLLLTATPRDLSKVKRVKIKKKKHSTRSPSGKSDSTESSSSTQSTTTTTTTESTRSDNSIEHEDEQKRVSSTRSNDSGFDGSPRLSNCDMVCHKKCEKLTGNLCGLNQKLVAEALQALKRAPSQSSDNQRHSDSSDHLHASGRITPPATNLPRFKKYTVEDFHFLKVLGKGSFGKVLLAELRGTDCVYAVKCLKKDVVLEDDDVECTLIERKVLTLATRHPYLCHLFCTFQTESHLFFVMEYLNGGDLMFHIQKSGRFAEFRARFYAAEIWSGLSFLHKKGIVYRDLKLDNVLLDFEGHIRIADFGMCKLQIFLDRTADTFCGTPDYMAPEIIKGLKYNQAVDWWSFGVLLYEMLTGQSPFSGCDEDELFWSICNERPFIPRYLSQEAMNILVTLLEKDAGKRPLAHDIQLHPFFHAMQWERLERRLLEPPFKPALEHTLDTKYFDTAFTVEKPRLTPVPEQILTSMDQGVFQGFSYTNPNATD
ncbi:uncharacterized protein PF11_0213-like isoform X1 [Aphidius gifuensis]|uniref:uncharacterized protein PF11_0213-like isoform X1 n=1 Tax=Aphidius gifuensis TaxID=684658 RepID=UPI001CDBC00B|nr:uncharacterized protein PF11_0213-like isoform X1 [Aphidius gifuensis]